MLKPSDSYRMEGRAFNRLQASPGRKPRSLDHLPLTWRLAVRIADDKELPELTARHIPGDRQCVRGPLPAACSLSSRRTNYGGCGVPVCRRTPALAVLCGDWSLSTEIATL